MEGIRKKYIKYKEIVNYLVFGILTTIVNFIVYFIVTRFLKSDEVLSSGIAWFCAVLFAYVTNKIFVFESKTNTVQAVIKELVGFFIARILSGILCDVGTFALMVKILKINDIIAKIVTQIMVVVVNYLFSKLVIFKRKNDL